MVEPCAENLVATKLATVLVGKDVVAVIGPRPVELEWAEDLTGHEQARDGSDIAVGYAGRSLEHEVEIFAIYRRFLPPG